MNNDPAPTGPILKSPPRVDAVRFTYSAGDRPLEGYTIKRGIGRGGFGEVYYGTSDGGKEVALKLVQRNLEVELRGVGHCLNLKHPNLVGLYDIRQADDGGYWIVMEYVAGDNLADLIDRHPDGLPIDTCRKWIEGICAGVAYLHDRGIVHRDLKPANLFMEDGTVKIGDYGLSKFITASRRSGQTESVGTVHYMAPEIAGGRYGKEIDIYAAGVILYEVLTGDVPFDGESVGEVLMKHLTAEADVGAVPEPFQPVVARALAKDPEQRFASIDEMLAAIRGDRVADAPVLPNPASRGVTPLPLAPLAPTRPRAQPVGSDLSVPVSIGDVYGGFAEAHGIVRLADDALHLEYTVKDSLFGVIRSRVKQASVPLSEIASVDLKTGLLVTLLCVRTSNLFVLERVPEAKSGELRLRVARDQRPAARALAEAVNRRIGHSDPHTIEAAPDSDATVSNVTDDTALRCLLSAGLRFALGVVLAVGAGLLVSAFVSLVVDSDRHHLPPEVFLGMGAGFFAAAVAWQVLLRRWIRTMWLGYPVTLAYGTGVMLMQVPFTVSLGPAPVEAMLPLGSGCLTAGLVGLVLLRSSRPVWLRLPLPLLAGFGFGSLVAGFGLLVAEEDPAIVLGLVSGVALSVVAVFWMLRALPYMWRAGIAMGVPMALGALAYWTAKTVLVADAPFPLLLATGVGMVSFAGALLTLFFGPLAVNSRNTVSGAEET